MSGRDARAKVSASERVGPEASRGAHSCTALASIFMEAFLQHVDANEARWIERLRAIVAVQSVSSDPARRGECVRMMELARDEIVALGGSAELQALGDEKPGLPLPPLLVGRIGADAAKPTVLVYGHLDVQPAPLAAEDGWLSPPFVLTARDGKMFGRGSTDDKGPMWAWFNAIESMRAVGKALPCNVKFVLEGMEESGSVGLEAHIRGPLKASGFFDDVLFSVISDNYFLGPRKPCLTYGLRGLVYFSVEVACAAKDLHSGVYGGPVHEAMIDLVKLLSSLQDASGRFDWLSGGVRPLSAAEEATYAGIDFDAAEFAAECGNGLRSRDKAAVLQARWRFPSLSIHGIEGAWAGAGAKTVIPRAVAGKFSIRIVPDMDPAEVERQVRAHLGAAFAALRSPNAMTVTVLSAARAWLSDVTDANYTAAHAAITKVFGAAPDLTREGGSIPVALWLEEATGKSVCLLPIGACDDAAHSQNEKLSVAGYIAGIKVLGTYLDEVAAAHAAGKCG